MPMSIIVMVVVVIMTTMMMVGEAGSDSGCSDEVGANHTGR